MILLAELGRSVQENLDLGRDLAFGLYLRPGFKIFPYRPLARFLRAFNRPETKQLLC